MQMVNLLVQQMKQIYQLEKEFLLIIMEMFMKVNLKMVKEMVMEFTIINQEKFMMVNG